MKISNSTQSDGFTYRWMVHITEMMLLTSFKKIHLYNMSGVPSDRPVLLASNHPTAFVDPLLLGCFLDPPIYNMTRGDIFKKPFFRKLLESVNMFPVFRQRDGYSDRNRNDEVFEYCFQKLKQKRVVTIYVEGEHHLEKQVRPLQKGIIRIAFGAIERHDLRDLEIIPVGVNYAVGDVFRDETMINVGQPIPVFPFFEREKNGEKKAFHDLLAEIKTGLEKVCFDIKSPTDFELAEQLLTLHRSENPLPILPIKIENAARFDAEKAILTKLNDLPETEKTALFEKTDSYFSELKKAGLEDFALVQPGWGRGGNLLFFALTFPLFFLGFLTSRPVVWVVNYALKNVKKREFISSVRSGAGQISGLVYYVIVLIVSVLMFGWWGILGWLIFWLSGFFYVLYLDFWKNWRAARRAVSSPKRADFLEKRGEIFG